MVISGDLSGGQMQRVFLCRAVIASPRILILDEPTTYVDSNFEKEFYTILEELNKSPIGAFLYAPIPY